MLWVARTITALQALSLYVRTQREENVGPISTRTHAYSIVTHCSEGSRNVADVTHNNTVAEGLASSDMNNSEQGPSHCIDKLIRQRPQCRD